MSRRRFISGIAKIFFWAVVLIALGPSLVNLPRAWVACRVWQKRVEAQSTAPDAAIHKVTDPIADYARPEDQTYLTLPEWYIVYSTDEYAAFIADHSSSRFPYFQAVGQYWQSYIDACNVVRGKYPVNGSEQFTLSFIGVSFTAENMLKGAYEGTIGRVTDWISASRPTDEEIFAAKTAKQYGAFLHETPWYFFPFSEKLQALWTETSLWGPDPIRKWERKFELTVEYGGKALYGAFTKWGAGRTYGKEDANKIYAVAEGVTKDMASDKLEIVTQIDKKRELLLIARFEDFSNLVPPLLARGLSLVEIAGNHEIMITLIAPQQANFNFQHAEYLYDLPILTSPGHTRVALRVQLNDLGAFFKELKARTDLKFEHMYDY